MILFRRPSRRLNSFTRLNSIGVITLAILPVVTAAAEPSTTDEPIATATVKSLSTAQRPSEASDMPMMMMDRPEAPVATLPDERLPQYQTGYRRTNHQMRSTRHGIRFLVVAPSIIDHLSRPMLVHVSPRVDGMEFDEFRQQQIASIKSAPPSEAVSEKSVNESEEEIETDETVDADDSESDITENASPSSDPTNSYQLATGADALARRYAAAVGSEASDEEIQWLMSHWSDGPALLLLHPYFQEFRADSRPAVLVLDRDQDGRISSDELASAATSFQACDANRDDVVDVTEIDRAANRLRDDTAAPELRPPLLVLLDDLQGLSDADDRLFAPLHSIDVDQNGIINDAEIDRLWDQAPDLDFVVEFDRSDPDNSSLSLMANRIVAAEVIASSLVGNELNIKIGETTIQFAAVQDSASRQISLGAVVDGYPLLPELDPNDDGRMTIRELRGLSKTLLSLDRDGDGELTEPETQSPIRVCIGLGATVHRELASIRTVDRPDQPTPAVGPDWFNRMDRNEDNDLSRGEFPGTDDQFNDLDVDGDQLISAEEANTFETP